jgi:hypothetical protein
LALTARETYWLENKEKWQLQQHSAQTAFFAFFSTYSLTLERRRELFNGSF